MLCGVGRMDLVKSEYLFFARCGRTRESGGRTRSRGCGRDSVDGDGGRRCCVNDSSLEAGWNGCKVC